MTYYIVRKSIYTEHRFIAVDDEVARKIAKEKREEWKMSGHLSGPQVVLIRVEETVIDL